MVRFQVSIDSFSLSSHPSLRAIQFGYSSNAKSIQIQIPIVLHFYLGVPLLSAVNKQTNKQPTPNSLKGLLTLLDSTSGGKPSVSISIKGAKLVESFHNLNMVFSSRKEERACKLLFSISLPFFCPLQQGNK